MISLAVSCSSKPSASHTSLALAAERLHRSGARNLRIGRVVGYDGLLIVIHSFVSFEGRSYLDLESLFYPVALLSH